MKELTTAVMLFEILIINAIIVKALKQEAIIYLVPVTHDNVDIKQIKASHQKSVG